MNKQCVICSDHYNSNQVELLYGYVVALSNCCCVKCYIKKQLTQENIAEVQK